jgi:hypothetical protein
VKLARFNPFRLLNSVPFGIMLMVLTAVFISCGSARPWFREMGVDEWPILRDWFDKTDMQFFNAWPLKTLMALLVANLIVVTWRRIPLTPPRYGVWCIHSGIITLICGTAFYYNHKIEGRVRIYSDPSMGPNVVDHFYDKDERSLYVRIGKDQPAEFPLPTLPRFKEYDEELGNTAKLTARGLSNIEPTLEVADRLDDKTHKENLADFIGCHGKLMFDITGFYPYAVVNTDFGTNPSSNMTGVEMTMQNTLDPSGDRALADWWLVGADPRFRVNADHGMDLAHVEADSSMASVMTEAAGQLFRLDITVPGVDKPVTLNVAIGKTYAVGKTGYTLKIESYQPGWPMFGTGEPVDMLQMMVTSPKQTFRRMVLQDKPVQTDFELGVAGAGPMGKRQKTPLDADLKIDFHVHDPYMLLPDQNSQQANSVKHTFLTPPGGTELIDIVAGVGTVASQVHRFPTGVEDIELTPDSEGMNAPFMNQAAASQPALSTNVPGGDPAANHPAVKIHVERHDHLQAVDRAVAVASTKRDKNAEDAGVYQVAKVHVSMGSWSQDVYAQFADDAGDRLRTDTWRGGFVTPPGAISPIQLQLGNRQRPLPVTLSLDRFQLVPYDGGTVDEPNAMMKDFISTVTLTPANGDGFTDKAHMNHPIYYDDGRWLFFQAAYDGSAAHAWTQLGVGNRPGTNIMRCGCVMIFFGLAYAFYAKPFIIRRMKQKAIANAVAAGKNVPQELVVS